ncbi:exonuclease III protein [Reticulomyxa filosa]|uniref:Exonuclease III protein n=1 Tax=Reticulomyxa filosa TaxID=46433 RepID=X6NUE4_RETFI|nr:exonuclease III protein [Reticulomyxa filosa]|eukprot:ETO29553.1 exonuclease III protein [Reticulomyxa filosa]
MLKKNKKTKTRAQPFQYLVVLDFEATCDDKNFGPQEIIEWPAVIIDTTTMEMITSPVIESAEKKDDGLNKTKENSVPDEFHYYIKPKVNPVLTKFCTELTGITQDTVNKGTDIETVISKWNTFVSEHKLTSKNACVITCGDWDLKKMWPIQKRLLKNQTDPLLFQRWINLKLIFAKFFQCKPKDMVGMLNFLNLKLLGRHHSGIDDVRNIARIVQFLLKSGATFYCTSVGG